jgi:hypothetical protein
MIYKPGCSSLYEWLFRRDTAEIAHNIDDNIMNLLGNPVKNDIVCDMCAYTAASTLVAVPPSRLVPFSCCSLPCADTPYHWRYAKPHPPLTILPGELEACSRPPRNAPRAEHSRPNYILSC